MTFLNPLALFALAAAAIPLIIHLFNFRRPRRVDFSSLAFLNELKQSTMQRVRIKQWLLLVLRTLALACLVLAFARPTLEGGAGSLGGRPATSFALVVDNSLSMSLRDAQGGYLDQAQAVATGLIEQAELGDEVFVVPTADASRAAPTAYTNRGPALDAVQELTTRPVTTTVGAAVARAAAALDRAVHANREIYVLADVQQPTWLDSAQTAVPDPSARVVLLPVGDRVHGNVAIVGVEVLSRIVEVGQPVRVEATLANYSTEPVDGYVASLYLEGERVAQATADLAPGALASVVFTVTPQVRGWLAGEVVIEDDAFDADNRRFFTLHVPEERQVLVVQGQGQRAEFVELALSPELTRGRLVFETDTIGEGALAATALGGYDAVVLVGPRDLSSGEVAALARYVEGGGGLLLFPSEGARAADYNALLQALGGGRFSGFSGAYGGAQSIATFGRVDLEHPLFEGVFEQGGLGRQIQVESPDVYFAMNYTPGGAAEQTLIELSSGFPFLHEVRHGGGAAFLLAAAPDPAWSDLPVRGLFIPLLYRSIYYLSAGESVQGDALVAGQPGEIRLAGVSEAEPLRLVGPDGDEVTPEQRTLFGALLLELDGSLTTPGIYAVQQGDDRVRRVAVNLDARESDLSVYANEEAAERLEEATGLPVRLLGAEGDAQAVLAAVQAERTGLELWNVFLALALAFLVAEMLVSMQWRPEPAVA